MPTCQRKDCWVCALIDTSEIEVNGSHLTPVANVSCLSGPVVYMLGFKCGQIFVGGSKLGLRRSVMVSLSDRNVARHLATCAICRRDNMKVHVLAEGKAINTKELKSRYIHELHAILKGLNSFSAWRSKVIPECNALFTWSKVKKVTYPRRLFPLKEAGRKKAVDYLTERIAYSPYYKPAEYRSKRDTEQLTNFVGNVALEARSLFPDEFKPLKNQ